nr:pentatricopeptide repeat-containing protein [Tanacetum cinerariifolium]
MFMTHVHQNLAKFCFQNLNNKESRDEATSRLRIHEIMVKYATNMFVDELISWAKEEVQTQTPKKKVVEHVVDDKDTPFVNLVEILIFKRKLLGRNNPSLIAKRKLMGKVTSPTSYVVNKGRSVQNEGSDKGKSIMVEDTNTNKKAVDKSKIIMVKEDRHVRLPVCRNNGIVIQENVNLSVVKSDTDSESDPAKRINYTVYSDSDSEYSNKSVDYLSNGEDELIELRKRKSEAKNAPKAGEKFVDVEQLKKCMTYYAIANGYIMVLQKFKDHGYYKMWVTDRED